MPKKLLLAPVVLLVAGFTLAGCSSPAAETAPTPIETSTESAPVEIITEDEVPVEETDDSGAVSIPDTWPYDIPLVANTVDEDSYTVTDQGWEMAFYGGSADLIDFVIPSLEGSGFTVHSENNVYYAESDQYSIVFTLAEFAPETMPEGTAYKASITKK